MQHHSFDVAGTFTSTTQIRFMGAGSAPNSSALLTFDNVELHASITNEDTTATFTQAPDMAQNFDLIAGGSLSITNYVNVSSGSLADGVVDIDAVLYRDATQIIDLGDATYNSSAGTLVWSTILPANVTVAAGETIKLDVINNTTAGIQIEYDSSTKPSLINLPTDTLIDMTELAVYDAPYPGGTQVTAANMGQTLYVRVSATDPFGAYDVTSIDLTIDDPNDVGDVSTTLVSADVVNSTADTATFEYQWNTVNSEGAFQIAAVAHEGFEDTITDTLTPITVILTGTDSGSPCNLMFVNTNGVPQTSFDSTERVCLYLVDFDHAGSNTLDVVITSDSVNETNTLTETGPSTGVFTNCSPESTFNPGEVITASYIDPTDPGDTCDAQAVINTIGGVAGVAITKSLVDPADGQALVGDTVTFSINVLNTGGTTLSALELVDTFDDSYLSFSSASVSPDSSTATTLTWDNIGPLAVGWTTNITVSFTTLATTASTVNSASVSGSAAAGPATDNVKITNPSLTVTKTLVSPNPGPANMGDSVKFRIAITNTGDTVISTLPLSFSTSLLYDTNSPAVPPPDGVGAGSLLWNDVGPLGIGATFTVDVNFIVQGAGNPANNNASVQFAVDENGDAVPPDSDNAQITTVAASIGDYVWYDLNGDGNQDQGEAPMVGAIVYLDLNTNGMRDANEPMDTTDSAGAYVLGDLAAGSYYVGVQENAVTANYVLSTTNALNAVALSAGENRDDIDFGFYIPPRLYGYAYLDEGASLTRNDGDGGYSNVIVQLWTNNVKIADTTTSTNGYYEFLDLVPGEFEVRFISNTNYLTATPDSEPGISNPERNRATPESGYATATYTLTSGHGLNQAGEPDDNIAYGEPVNAGFLPGSPPPPPPPPTSSGIDLRAYQTAEGVVVELIAYDVEEDGTIKLALLDANGDEVGKWREANGVTVGSFDAEMTSASLTGITLSFDSMPDREYEILWTEQLGSAWHTATNVPSQGEQTTVVVALPESEASGGFFKIMMK